MEALGSSVDDDVPRSRALDQDQYPTILGDAPWTVTTLQAAAIFIVLRLAGTMYFSLISDCDET